MLCSIVYSGVHRRRSAAFASRMNLRDAAHSSPTPSRASHSSSNLCRMNTYEKHRGVGGAAFLARGTCPDPVGALRGVLLTSHPMRMRILGITFFFASLFCAAAVLSPAFAGANRVQASAPDDAADLRAAKE